MAKATDICICVLVPTYNNAGTIGQVVQDVVRTGYPLWVICDGCTDDTTQALQPWQKDIHLIGYQPNRGKSYALEQGFKAAYEAGYTHAITMDADGQHLVEDLPALTEFARRHPLTIAVGARRQEEKQGQNAGSAFANRFSNFWFHVQTAIPLEDTQCGLRLYPLRAVQGIRLLGHRYEGELELLVRLAWRGWDEQSLPVHVYYPPKEERVSHFRPGIDFLRISLLNTLLTLLAIVYGLPARLMHRLLR